MSTLCGGRDDALFEDAGCGALSECITKGGNGFTWPEGIKPPNLIMEDGTTGVPGTYSACFTARKFRLGRNSNNIKTQKRNKVKIYGCGNYGNEKIFRLMKQINSD